MADQNKRIYYASQAIQLRPCDKDGVAYTYWYHPLGVQSVSMSTNFAREQVFQMGTLEIYENIETVPEVEVSITKVIDQTAPLYLMCMGGKDGITGTDGSNNNELVALSNNRVNFTLGIYEDDKQYVSNDAKSYVLASGMYLSSFNYTFPVEGNATEQVTLVGNHKQWNKTHGNILAHPVGISTAFDGTQKFAGDTIDPSISSGIFRRQFFNINNSVIPTGSGAIGGQNINKMPHFQNISISCSLNRESINSLGSYSPYVRYANFPIEVTSEFETTATDGDNVDANDFRNDLFCGSSKTNISGYPIRIALCDDAKYNGANNASNSLVFDLGDKNTLTSVNYTGGDAGGGNATITYSFRNFNNFKINASGTYEKSLTYNAGSVSAQAKLSTPNIPVVSNNVESTNVE